jgi:hypothetical protein
MLNRSRRRSTSTGTPSTSAEGMVARQYICALRACSRPIRAYVGLPCCIVPDQGVVAVFTEKRMVGGSTPPLTPQICGNAT